MCLPIPPSMSILLVEDEANARKGLTQFLQGLDYDVITAANGNEAMALFKSEKPDLVISDIRMPEMDGIETLKRIKAIHPLVEVIMLTGHATFETAIQGMKLGAFDYLMKPCEIDDLITKLEAAKKKHQEQLEKIMEAAGKKLRGERGR